MDSMDRLTAAGAVERLWARDASLFSDDPAVQAEVAPWLGWLGLGEAAGPALELGEALAADLGDDDVDHVILLGMGGSSLAPLVMSLVLPVREGAPSLTVLDTSSPAAVERVMSEKDPAQCAFVVASKSGGTIEPNSLYAVFRAWMDTAMGRETAGRRFIATTDPGSSLEALAGAEGFRAVLPGPVDVGGRYSALSVFGLVPASLIGLDARLLAERAAAMESRCRLSGSDNPGAALAAWMGDAHADRRDKLTIVASSGLESLSLWIEQLVAESTGKQGTGIVPVPEIETSIPTEYGDDRAVAVIRWTEDHTLADWAEAVREEAPVIELVLADPYDLGGELVRWEVATALAGQLLGINPFDQPSVTEAKEATSAILDGGVAPPTFTHEADGVRLSYANIAPPTDLADLASGLAPLVDSLEPHDYLAVLAYVPDDPGTLAPLQHAAKELSRKTGNAPIVQMGPRYLHSTGQLHKGGPNTGVFLVVTTADQTATDIPGRDFTLAELFVAQAYGDVATLARHGRRAVLVELPDAGTEALAALGLAIGRAT